MISTLKSKIIKKYRIAVKYLVTSALNFISFIKRSNRSTIHNKFSEQFDLNNQVTSRSQVYGSGFKPKKPAIM